MPAESVQPKPVVQLPLPMPSIENMPPSSPTLKRQNAEILPAEGFSIRAPPV